MLRSERGSRCVRASVAVRSWSWIRSIALTSYEGVPTMNHRSAPPSPLSGGICVDLTLTADQETFREEIRRWLKTNIPADWTSRVAATADVPRPEAYDILRAWQRKLYEA